MAALIIAEDEESGLAPPVPPRIFGQCVAEFQCRSAHQAGAKHILILTERLPLELMAAVDRLQRDGIGAEIVRTPRDAADHIHPEERVLVISGPVIPHGLQLQTLSVVSTPSLLTVSPDQSSDVTMRIDAAHHWSGLALLDGTQVRETIALLGEWALVPTLLRRAVQSGTALLPAPDGEALMPVRDEEDARRHAAVLLGDPSQTQRVQSVSAALAGRFGRWLAPHILRAPPIIPALDATPMVLGMAGLALAVALWPKTGLTLLLLALLASGIVRPFSQLPIGRFRWLTLFHKAWPWMVSGGLSGYAVMLGQKTGSWSALVLALWLATLLRPLPGIARWYADAGSAAAIILFAGLAGFPMLGFMVAIAHGLASRLHGEHRSRA